MNAQRQAYLQYFATEMRSTSRLIKAVNASLLIGKEPLEDIACKQCFSSKQKPYPQQVVQQVGVLFDGALPLQ